MPLHWRRDQHPDLVMIEGTGEVTRHDIKECLSAFKGQAVDRHGKVINLLFARLVLTPDEIETIGHNLGRYCTKPSPGAIALVVHDSLNLDMAILLKQRVQARKFRVFADESLAIRWLETTSGAGAPATPQALDGDPRDGSDPPHQVSRTPAVSALLESGPEKSPS